MGSWSSLEFGQITVDFVTLDFGSTYIRQTEFDVGLARAPRSIGDASLTAKIALVTKNVGQVWLTEATWRVFRWPMYEYVICTLYFK